jgi:hypothetical protein
MWVMSSTICQKLQGNYEHSGVKGVKSTTGNQGAWGSRRKVIQGDYILLVAVKTNMPCDTKRAKRYKPFVIRLKHAHHHGKSHDKRITRSITTKHTYHPRWNAHKRPPLLHIYIRGSIKAQDIWYLQSHFNGHVTRRWHIYQSRRFEEKVHMYNSRYNDHLGWKE